MFSTIQFTCQMYATEERIFLVKNYYKTKSIVTVQREFKMHFKCLHRKIPARSVISRLIQKFESTGKVHDNRATNVGAKRTARTNENREALRTLLKENPAPPST